LKEGNAMPIVGRGRWKTGVYLITNRVNGKVYVGSTARYKGIPSRISCHKTQLRKGKHGNLILQRAWDKYGEDAFEFSVLTTCPPEDCIRLEQIFIDQYNAADRKYGYNICPTAASTLGTKRTAEQVERIAAKLRGKKRTPLSEEHKAKISLSLKGMKRSVESRIKLSIARTGSKLSQEHKDKLAEIGKGRKMSPEAIAKTAAAHRGMKRSAETKAKLSAARRMRPPASAETRARMSLSQQMRRLNIP
jgi:group I intron endonuclease